MNIYLQLGAFGLLAWIVKRLGDAVADRIGKGDSELVAAIGELKNLLIAQREESRFLRESFASLTSHMSDLVQRWKVADAILSRLWSTRPGHVDWNGELIGRMFAYGAVPVVTLFVTFFPEVGNSLFAWLEPVKRVLPF